VAFGSGGYPERKLVRSRPGNHGVGCHLARPPETCNGRVFSKTLRILATGGPDLFRAVAILRRPQSALNLAQLGLEAFSS
jgi:hypothetical protein